VGAGGRGHELTVAEQIAKNRRRGNRVAGRILRDSFYLFSFSFLLFFTRAPNIFAFLGESSGNLSPAISSRVSLLKRRRHASALNRLITIYRGIGNALST